MTDYGHSYCLTHRTYKLSCEDYDGLLRRAQDRCELCGVPRVEAPNGQLCIEHDHRYSEPRVFFAVRGLVCHPCNAHLRRIDEGVPPDGRTSQYLLRAWFLGRHKAPVDVVVVERPKRPPLPPKAERKRLAEVRFAEWLAAQPVEPVRARRSRTSADG